MRTKITFIFFLFVTSLSFGQSQDKLAEQIKKLSPDVGLVADSASRRYIKEYLSNPQKTADIIQLSYRYLPEITDSLEEHDLPTILRFLTMSSSGFNLKSVSQDGGSGIWHMKYIPAKNNGIRITSYVDYRRDFRVETSASIQYLTKLFIEFKDWKLAILAYYSDSYEVQKAIKRANSSDFAKIQDQMPAKYKSIIPKFTAAAYIFNHAEEYNFPKPQVKDLPKMTEVSIEKWSTIHQISKAIKSDESLLEEANPIFKKGVIPHASYTYDLLIPANKAEVFYELGDSVYTFPTHSIESGEVNPITKPKAVAPKGSTKQTTTNSRAKGKKMLYYTVRRGDVLGKISDLYDVRVSDLRRWNGIRGDRINVGQRLKVYVPASRYSYYARINKMSASQKSRIRAKD